MKNLNHRLTFCQTNPEKLNLAGDLCCCSFQKEEKQPRHCSSLSSTQTWCCGKKKSSQKTTVWSKESDDLIMINDNEKHSMSHKISDCSQFLHFLSLKNISNISVHWVMILHTGCFVGNSATLWSTIAR